MLEQPMLSPTPSSREASTWQTPTGGGRPNLRAKFQMSVSFKSPKATTTKAKIRPTLASKSQSCVFHRPGRPHQIDGNPLPHWDPSNFQLKRDASCRKIVIPKVDYDRDNEKGGKGPETFFQKVLSKEDYALMRAARRRTTTSSRASLEQPFFSKYNRYFPTMGHFCCKACGNPLYAHDGKIHTADGWPAFGACVDGSIDMITADEQRRQLQEEIKAATTIQRVFRGAIWRIKVNNVLAQLIEDLQARQAQLILNATPTDYGPSTDEIEVEGVPESWDMVQSRHYQIIDHLVLEELGGSSSSFCYDHSASDGLDFLDTSTLSLPMTLGVVDGPEEDEDDLLNEIHCHRCKSHLGSASTLSDNTRGLLFQEQVLFREHHLVNGRAIKYVDNNLSKRTDTKASLFFANQSQQRLQGLQAQKERNTDSEPLYARRSSLPFVSPRSNRPKLKVTSDGNNTFGPGLLPKLGDRAVSCKSPKTTNRNSKQPFIAKTRANDRKSLEKLLLSRSMH